MLRLSEIVDDFEQAYREAIRRVRTLGVSLTVCTIYDGHFTDPVEQRVASATVRLFNDAIYRVANENGVSVIDLRSVCNRSEDYANPIEPSSVGGAKIARAIVGRVL
jgi:hypothetical protein